MFEQNVLSPESCFFLLNRSIRRPGQSPEKMNGGMILAPLAGIILNLLDANKEEDHGRQNDIVEIFAGMGCAETILRGFYLLECNWVSDYFSNTIFS